jgi:hypothetical protein
MPTMWNLLVASMTVASVWGHASLESPETLNKNDASTSHRLQATGSCTGRVTGWELIDTKNNTKVMDLVNGTIVYSDDPSFSIRVVVSGSGTRSVKLTLDRSYTNTENEAPYALCTNTGNTYRRCGGLTVGKHMVTGAACCDKSGRGTCQRPPTALAFEIRRPTKPPTKPPTKAPTKPPTKPPTKAPTKAPMKAPTTKAPTKAQTSAPTNAPTNAPTKAPLTTPTKAPTKHPTQAPVCAVKGDDGDGDGCCGAGVTAVNYTGGCCPVGNIAVPNLPEKVNFCCPNTTLVADSLGHCCKLSDILAPSPSFNPLRRAGFCCPINTSAAAITFGVNGIINGSICCPPNTGVNAITRKCCEEGQQKCCEARNGTSGCCNAAAVFNPPLSTKLCCPLPLVPVPSNTYYNPLLNFSGCCSETSIAFKQARCGPPNTGINLFTDTFCPTGQAECTKCKVGEVEGVGCCSAEVLPVTRLNEETRCPNSANTNSNSTCPGADPLSCCEAGEVLVPNVFYNSVYPYCCPNGTLAADVKGCCPLNTGTSPTGFCCPAGQATCFH